MILIIYEIKIPRLSVNDDIVILAEWLVEDGTFVHKDDDIVVYETTKETVEGKANQDGYIHIHVMEGAEKEVGTVIATITDTEKANEDLAEAPTESGILDDREYTNKAWELVKKYNVDVGQLPTDRIIREKDVTPFICKPYQITETHTNDLIIYGAGGFAHIIIDLLKQTCVYKLNGIVDMNYPDLMPVNNVDVIGDDNYLNALIKKGSNKVVNAVGLPLRTDVYKKLKKSGFELPNLVHRSAVIEPTVIMGEGNLIFAGAIVGSEVIIGNDCVINSGAIVNHECIISDNCHVASGAILAGCVTVGENTLIGQGATVYQRVSIGKNVIIQNGCHIFNDVPDGSIIRAR